MFLRLLLAWVVVGVAVVEEEVDVDVLGGGVGGSGDGCPKRAALLDMCGRCVRKKKKEKKQKRQYCLPLVDVAAAAGFALARRGIFGGGS